MNWMVLHRPFELARETGKVRTKTHLSGKRVYEDLSPVSWRDFGRGCIWQLRPRRWPGKNSNGTTMSILRLWLAGNSAWLVVGRMRDLPRRTARETPLSSLVDRYRQYIVFQFQYIVRDFETSFNGRPRRSLREHSRRSGCSLFPTVAL